MAGARRVRGVSAIRRASLSFSAFFLLCSGAAQAHHIPVSSRVPAWNLFLWIGLLVLVAVEVAFVLRVRREGLDGPRRQRLENVWMMMPLTVLLVLGVVRVTPFFRASVVQASAGEDAPRIEVIAHQWRWAFRYVGDVESGNVPSTPTLLPAATGPTPRPTPIPGTVAVLRLPAGQTVQLILSTRDIVHSFDVPQLGVRADIMPGQPLILNIRVNETGHYDLYCSALCGVSRQEMSGVIEVVPPDEYTGWASQQTRNVRQSTNE